MPAKNFHLVYLTIIVLSLLASRSNFAGQVSTVPVDGLRDNTPSIYALVGGRIHIAPGQEIAEGRLIIRRGVITAVGEGITIPRDAHVWDMSGKSLYPGLIDAYSEMTVQPVRSGAPYWNSLVQPQLDIAQQYQSNASLNKAYRDQGITARLVAPSSGIIKGTSAVVTTADAEGSQAILRDRVALHVRLTVPRRRGRNQYPNSPMGAVALARQAMYDGQWYAEAWKTYRADNRVPRPERNDALASLSGFLQDRSLIIIDSPNQLYALRADRFAREFSLRIALRGSGNEYRRLEAIRRSGRTVIVPVDFPKAPNVATAESALGASLSDLMHWDIAPENPARLVQAGVPIVLTSHGLSDRNKFLAAVRTAVRRGLSPDTALKALTTEPAKLLKVDDRLGTLEVGRSANIVVTDGDLFEEETKIHQTWIDGILHKIETPPLVDLRGNWQMKFSGGQHHRELMMLTLKGTPDELKGSIVQGEKEIKLTRAGLKDSRFSCTFPGKDIKHPGIVRLTAVVSISRDTEPTWTGQIVWPDGTRRPLKASRVKDEESDGASKDKGSEDSVTVKELNEDEKNESSDKAIKKASYEVNYPLGAFGRSAPPQQPELVLLKNATIWTCSKEGVLENASILIGRGKIINVGKKLDVPSGAEVIDLTGKHLTPGIIDCHSHIATDGGVNESTQAITAEVRIGDFIDSRDINLYRQLAGGVTSSNILHGSANPIGGQNQVIKLRWGALPEQMKFSRAPQGIKFALGENVKQSNRGDDYRTRYPQTRMGVEQIVRDEFLAARQYRSRWNRWRKNHRGLPPRRDLELDAIAEILSGKRWIHCHSYRQDEILALIRTLDEFNVQIGTFQHILEGYKVADQMAEHGAMGSSFSDWWAYKFEVFDAIPYNGSLMHNAGVVVSFNSDDAELARHLNHEAGKAVKYGSVDPEEALKFVTLNPAKQLRIDKYVGSLEAGKDADFVVWHGKPLSTYSRCEQTWVDGRKYFDLQEDKQERLAIGRMRVSLVQKILQAGAEMRKEGENTKDDVDLWPREDIYCVGHDHTHGY